MSASVKIAIAGVGLVGKQHLRAISSCNDIHLSALVDPCELTGELATALGKPWFRSLSDLFKAATPDGVILATPNQTHVENGLDCVKAGCPVLVEKPIATSAQAATVLVDEARSSGVPLLVGHHRRHNPLIKKAKELIDDGRIGQIRAVHANCWMYKPEDYFDDSSWRKRRGAGPMTVNLIHDIDLIRHLCGEIESVYAQTTQSIRGYENEDVAVALLQFCNGASGTVTASDMIVAPWSWELTAGENPKYPRTTQSCYLIGGTRASLSLPDLTLWQSEGDPSWWNPMAATVYPRESTDPLVAQIQQFAAVIRGQETPIVSGEEGLNTLRVVEAMQRSSATGERVYV